MNQEQGTLGLWAFSDAEDRFLGLKKSVRTIFMRNFKYATR